MRKLIIPKTSKSGKRKDANKTRKIPAESAKRDELVAPLTWAQRLKRVFNMMGPPSDH
jgi:hypothetical protein